MFYFAYGSNMDAARMEKRECFFKSRTPGSLPGYELVFNKRSTENPQCGFANIIHVREELRDKRVVHGVLYEVSKKDLLKLDKFEGVTSDNYRKQTMLITTPGGKHVEAVVYKAVPEKTAPGLKPTREYLNHLLAGKGLLPKDYYNKLASTEVLDPPHHPESLFRPSGEVK